MKSIFLLPKIKKIEESVTLTLSGPDLFLSHSFKSKSQKFKSKSLT